MDHVDTVTAHAVFDNAEILSRNEEFLLYPSLKDKVYNDFFID